MLKPWEQLAGETSKAYHCFRKFLEMQPEQRSVKAAYYVAYGADKKETHKKRAPDFVHKWSERFRWHERALEYDRHFQEEFNLEVSKHSRANARKWAKRQEQVREDEWELRDKLKKKIERMLMFDVSRQRIEDGGKTIIIEPVDFKFSNITPMVKAFVEISRLSVDMPTSKKEISIKDLREDVKKLSSQLGVEVDVDEAIALAAQLAESESIH